MHSIVKDDKMCIRDRIKALRSYDEKANIVAIDYDPGASNVNQLNRIKMMMATAFKNMAEEEEDN